VEQTVDRAASPPASPRVSGGSLSRSERPRTTHEWQLALLPVRSGRELAIGLARQWQDWSGAQSAVVLFGFLSLGRKWIAESCGGNVTQIAESAFDRAQAEAGLETCLGVGRCVSPSEARLALPLPFSTAADAFGGVLLHSPHEVPMPASDCEAFTLLSGRLVEQAAIVEATSGARRALEAAKGEAIAEFAAGAGHEINNPLATIAGRVQMLLRDETDFNRRQDLATIGAQSLRVRDMIGDLMLFARPPAPSPQRLLLNDVVLSVLDRFRQAAPASRNVEFDFPDDRPVFATADPTQLQIVLSELIRNGLDSIDSISDRRRGQIVIRLERSESTDAPAAVLAVTDNGPGLSDKDRVHLFDPYYSGREAGRGLGFGLCKCRSIANRHGGWIEVDSVPGVATTFRVLWPDAAGSQSAESGESPSILS
jgi:signal transduction histidine kinase